MRFLPEGRFPADQEKEGSGRDGRVLEYRSDRRSFELLDARVIARRRWRGWRRSVEGGQRQRKRWRKRWWKWWRKCGWKRWRRQDHGVHDHYQSRPRCYVDAPVPSAAATPPPPPPTPKPESAPASGDRGRRTHNHGSVGVPAHGHRDEREPALQRAGARSAEDEAREERVAGGETRTESGQDVGHHHRGLCRVLAAVLHHGSGHAPVPGLRDQRVRIQLLPVVGLLQFHPEPDHLHRFQSRVPVGIHQNDLRHYV